MVVYCVSDVNESPVFDSAVGMKAAIENHLANIGTQISPADSHNAVLSKGDSGSHQLRTIHSWRLALHHLVHSPV